MYEGVILQIICFFFASFLISCGTRPFEEEASRSLAASSPLPNPSVTSQPVLDTPRLCRGLRDLKRIPYREPSDDEVYDSLVHAGYAVLPCLIDKITDISPMNDPREAPPVVNFKLGDAAVLMLLEITKQADRPEIMLPPDYAKMWKTEGMYAYFAYVGNYRNRKRLQQWWQHWLNEHPRE